VNIPLAVLFVTGQSRIFCHPHFFVAGSKHLPRLKPFHLSGIRS
jgi:hypothetical protein